MSMKSTCAISSAISFLTPQPCEKLFRRRRGDEFLETRIAAERIEHWIEPERRRSERHVRYQYTCAPWSVSRVFLEAAMRVMGLPMPTANRARISIGMALPIKSLREAHA